MTSFIGIDPGVSGGIAILNDRGQVGSIYKRPPTLYGLLVVLRNLHSESCHGEPCKVMLERVGGFMGFTAENAAGKINPASAHTMFKFGQGYGHLEALITAADLDFELVSPAVWQRGVGIVKRKGEPQSRWKSRLAAHARMMHPTVKITLATADALLIATHCWMTHRGR